jgi:hypothetical protein
METNEHKKPPKEYIELLEKKLYVKEVGIENRLMRYKILLSRV